MTVKSQHAGRIFITLVAGLCGLLVLVHPGWRSEARALDYNCQCDLECSVFEFPEDPDAVIDLVITRIPIMFHCDLVDLVSDSVRLFSPGGGTSSLEGCSLQSCSVLRNDIISLEQLESEEDILSWCHP
jgi:hypothetical protein